MAGMSVVAHNLSAMNASRQLGITGGNQAKSSEKLSSGYKINRAADDAAGLSISEKMRKQIRGLTRGTLNAEDGVSLCQVADGALNEVHDMLQRVNELSVQSANGTNSFSDRQAIQAEVSEIIDEIDRVSETTKFNEIYLFRSGSSIKKNSEIVDELLGMNAYSLSSGQYADFPELTERVQTPDANVPSISPQAATGLMHAVSSILIASEIQEMDVYLTNEPTEASQKAAGMLSQSWLNMAKLSTTMNDPSSPDYSTTGALAVWKSGWTDIMASVPYNLVQHVFASSADDLKSFISNVYPGFTFREETWMDRCLLLYQHIIEDIGSRDHGSTYDYIPWLKGQTWLYGSIDRNTNQKLSDPTLGPLVGGVGDYGLSGFIDLAKDYMQKTTWLKEGELYDLFQELYAAGSNAERKVVACEIYRYLYEGPDMPIPIQAGAERGEGNRINIMVHKMNSARLGLSDIDVTTEEGAGAAIGAAGAAIARISAIRSKIGAQQNRLEHTIKHQKNTVENTQAAESRIRDTDMAEEMVRYAKESILQQAGQSMLAQANHSTEGILALLR